MPVVHELLWKGADPNQGLRGAAAGGHASVVDLMLRKGANPNEGLAPATRAGHMDVVELLISRGASPEQREAQNDADAAQQKDTFDAA